MLSFAKKLFIFVPILLLSCKEKTLFTQLSSSETGVSFANNIVENDTMNILSYEYVYNGGGVAAGDFNNDGLSDLFFTANTGDNKLYMNKGALKFEDVTDKALPKKETSRWSSGVALVDLNNDKLLDIYVCNTTRKQANLRANQLFINQGIKNGIPSFVDQAADFGIADTTYTTNAAFFDYDNDGDLDLYLLVNKMNDSRLVTKFEEKTEGVKTVRTHRLYRNNTVGTGKRGFTDVSEEAGILHEGFGLGLNISDINQDGWRDIYVTNDFLTADLMYINNQNGTFTNKAEQYFKHTSQAAMGNDIADINNDGLMDIIAVDMMPKSNDRKKTMMPANNYNLFTNNDNYKYLYQFARNTLQLNLGKNPVTQEPIFSEIGLMAGVAETDWSWNPSLADMDNDGFRDLMITNGFPKDITDQDFIAYRSQNQAYVPILDMRDSIPAVKLTNYAFRNTGHLQFEDVSKSWGIDQQSFSNGAVYADLDNDGDLDYVVNNINSEAMIFRNNLVDFKTPDRHFLRVKLEGGPENIMGLGAKIELFYQNQRQIYEHSPYRGYLSTVEPIAHFGLGKTTKIDRMVITWPNGLSQTIANVSVDKTLTVKQLDAKEKAIETTNSYIFTEVSTLLGIDYLHTDADFIDFNIQKLLLRKYSQDGPKMTVGDVNGDGLEDVFIGGAVGQKGTLLMQNLQGKFQMKPLDSDPENKPFEDAGSAFVDIDNDNDPDLVVASGSYEMTTPHAPRLYINDGKGNFSRDSSVFQNNKMTASCVRTADYDKDGDQDVFIAGRIIAGQYPQPASSVLFVNHSKPNSISFKTIKLNDLGLISDAIWSDFDGDSWPDLVLTAEFSAPVFMKNMKGKGFEHQDIVNNSQNFKGMWSCLKEIDVDNDGDKDYVMGNLGLNNILKVSTETPLTVYGKDFDKDGFFDAIPTVYFPNLEGKSFEVPLHSRDDLFKQMISLRKKFTSYKTFSKTSIDKILSKDDLDGALKLQANYLHTSVLINNKGKFDCIALPIEAQTAPINDLWIDDLNLDKKPDVLLIGNDYGNEVSVGKYDAFNGLILYGTGTQKFIPSLPSTNGFWVDGDAKSLVKVKTAQNKAVYMASQNKGKLKAFVQH